MKLNQLFFLLICTLTTIIVTAQQPHTLSLKYPKVFKSNDWPLGGEFLQELVDIFHADIFIETGTYQGMTTEQAAPHFKEIHTIELSPSLAQQAQQYLSVYPNVHVHCGDSPTVLSQLLKHTNTRIIFWLDGHYSWGITAQGSKNTPILEEIAAIEKSGINNAIILIDDIRCFQPAKAQDIFKDYPSVEEVETAILKINSNYILYIMGDIGIAFLKSDKVLVSPVIEACTLSRISDTKKIAPEKLILAEKIISAAQGEEQATLKSLCEKFKGISGHFYLWYALILTHQGDIANAKIYEHQANLLGIYRHV